MTKKDMYVDENFLGGELNVIVDNKTVYGTYFGCNACGDDNCSYTISATATCHPEDDFDVKKGIDIVKSKIVKKYYSNIKRIVKEELMDLERTKRELENIYRHAAKKVDNIARDMTTVYGFNFYGVTPVETKPKVETKTVTKVTKSKTTTKATKTPAKKPTKKTAK